jgi:cysteine desulfurase
LVHELNPATVFHSDATQAAGKVAIDLQNNLDEVDLLSLSAHKFHGPKGVGGLFLRSPHMITPLFFGGGQQVGLRPGTENPAAAVGMATALRAAGTLREPAVVAELRDFIEKRILATHPGSFALGSEALRLPNTSLLCLPGIDADDIVDRLAVAGFAVSTGSACSRGATTPSHVALAMGLTHAEAKSCIRISLSTYSSLSDLTEFSTELARLIGNELSQSRR